MLTWWDNYRNRGANRLAEIKENTRKQNEAIKKEYNDSVKTMTSKPCPFRSWGKCSTECVHFNKGGIQETPNWEMDDFVVIAFSPACKLWK